MLGLVLASSAQGSAQARSGLSDRPPLPAMGPSLRKAVAFATSERPGTIIIRKNEKALYLVTRQGQALRYQISVGRDGFGWTGVVKVGAKTEWPQWRPPKEMRARQPELPELVPASLVPSPPLLLPDVLLELLVLLKLELVP